MAVIVPIWLLALNMYGEMTFTEVNDRKIVVTDETEFDPYLTWLGIDCGGKIPDHYTLLGLSRSEQSEEVIKQAVDRQMTAVRQHQTGPRGACTQPVLNHISAAKVCMLDRRARRDYDALIDSRADGHDTVIAMGSKTDDSDWSANGDSFNLSNNRTALTSRPWFPIFAAFFIVVIGATIWGIGRSLISASTGNAFSNSNLPAQRAESGTFETNGSLDPTVDLDVLFQAEDKTISMPSQLAALGSEKMSLRSTGGTTAIVGWGAASASATWSVNIDDCRDGYFRAILRYRSDSDCMFELYDDQKLLGTVSLPSSPGKIRSEEKFVRLTRNRRYELILKPKRLGSAGTIEIFGLKLNPRK